MSRDSLGFPLGLFKEALKALDEVATVIIVYEYVATFDTANDILLKQIWYIKTRCTWHMYI